MIFPFNDDNPIERTPLATYALIAINVFGFLWVQRLPPADQQIIDLPALFVLGGWFIYQVVAGQLSLQQEATASVAWWAHAGGFIAGMVLMPGFSAAVGAKPTRGFPKTHYCDDSSTNH